MSKKFISTISLIVAIFFQANANVLYNNYFADGVLRFDYILTGNNNTTQVIETQQKFEPIWGGSKNYLIDTQNYGTFRFQVFSTTDNTLIFSSGFSPLFQEWQSTDEAKTIQRAYNQVIRFPFPKQTVKLKIDKRNWNGQFVQIYTTNIDPNNYFINRETAEKFATDTILKSGNPVHKIDIAILAEGYTTNEMDKFVNDAKRLTDSLFNISPFKEMKNYFNIYAIKTPSAESGTDIPGEKSYKNTIFNSNFYTFDVSRYLTVSDLKTVHDKAANLPYDQLYVLVNSKRYGGGGFYNSISVCTADNSLSPNVFVHEFGHAFAGLADEYYTSAVATSDYYNLAAEPWEPNITTLVNFETKWKSLIEKSTPIPTPRNKEYANKTGVFEGGGYAEKGIYSPAEDCRMKSNATKNFCPACKKAIHETIILNTK